MTRGGPDGEQNKPVDRRRCVKETAEKTATHTRCAKQPSENG